tara:strand:- start:5202 stop:5984 length:783 start_codon:yes stop_codon:yes gene_type:complete
MDPNLDSAITDAVRRWARPTTVEELQKRGVRNVRSVSMTRIAGLLEKAVNRALVARTIGDLGEDNDSFSRAARAEFVKMVQTGEAVEDDTSPAAAGTALDRLKVELRERRAVLQEQQAELTNEAAVEGPSDQQLEAKLKRLFQAWGGDPEKPTPLEKDVVRVAVAELQAERRRGRQALIDNHRKQMDTLERRVTKLSGVLQSTQAELKTALGREFADPGVGSIYTDVQGLDGGDSSFDKKTALMASIFEANLELRANLAS